MKSATFLKLLLLVLPLVFVSTRVLANELDSPNYKMIGVSTSGGGGIMESTNYSMISNVGRISADPRNYSTNYRLDQDPAAIFRAAQPTIQCFETDTNGTTTNCTSGPQELTDGGMIAICGPGGCYNKARFEIAGTNRLPGLDSSLVGFWGFNESTGTGAYLLDSSGNSNHGTPSGTTYTDGVIDGARSFNGSTDYVRVGDSPELRLDGDAYTIMAWINHDASSASGSIVSKASWVAGSYRFRYDHTDGPRIRWHGFYGGGTKTVDYDVNLTPGGWNHIAVSAENTVNNKVVIKLFLNGEEKTSQEVDGPITGNTTDVDIGSLGGSAQAFNGLIDDVRIFNRALPELEILQEYEYGTGKRANPSDTLYMIQISTDNFVSDIKCVDGSILKPKTLSNCDINDFRTKTDWESEDFNLRGLQGDITYYIRASALHGDFTQSDFSIPANATTTAGGIEFDIDIATSTGYDTESSPPYSIEFSGSQTLMGGGVAMTSPSLIWLDIESSSVGGVAIIQFGKYGGLYSSTTTETIQSTNLDLDSSGAEGFGLQNYYIDHEISTYLGYLTATTNYFGVGNTVGEVSTTARKIYDGDGPISAGRTGLYVKARASSNRTPASDYTESIYFILVPRY